MALGLTPKQIIDKGTHPLLVKKNTWLRVELGDICIIQNGYAFSSKYFNHNKGLPLIRIRDIFQRVTENLYSGEYSEEFLVRRNDFLIGMDGDFKISKWPGELGLLNQRVCRIILQTNWMSKEYVFLCIQPYLDAIHSETSAVTVKHLSSKTISEIPIPLPPLPEQRAIVKKIEALFSSLDAGIGDLKKAQDQLKIYRQAVLKKAFEGELTKDWREKQSDLPTAEELLVQIEEQRQAYYEKQIEDWKAAVTIWENNGKEGKKPEKPKFLKISESLTNKDLDKIPKLNDIWQWVKIDRLSFYDSYSLKAGPFGSSLKKEFYVSTGYKVYGQEQVIGGNIDIGDYYVDESKYQELYNCKVEPNDILISLVGTVGKVLILPKNSPKGIINPRLVKITLNRFYNTLFFKYYFESSFLKSLYKLENHGTTMDVLNLEIIKGLPFPLCSLEEQAQIVKEIEARLSVCEAVEQQIKDSLGQAEALRQSILKKAFEGRLLSEAEVTACQQEPDYEPASVLLEKIKAEKEALKPVKKSKK